MSDFDEKVIERLKRLEREVERLRVQENGKFVALTTPLTSTSWDGDARSTTAKTKIDLSAVFGVPAGVKAILVSLIAHDSGSATSTTIYFGLSPNDTSGSLAVFVYPRGVPANTRVVQNGVCPCNSDGDVYYQCVTSGTNSMGIFISIWGYWL